MDFLLRLVQVHETFRIRELEALAEMLDINLKIVSYNDTSPFCIIRLDSADSARRLISRQILSFGIYELWGIGTNYGMLHADVKSRSPDKWKAYRAASFKFKVDTFQGKRSEPVQRELIETFSYLAFEGGTRMKNPDLEMCIFEDYELDLPTPHMLYLGRFIASSGRAAIATYDLKKRKYISTTSMDSELALVTANLTHAGPGKLFFDPFMGTGSFPIACAHFGAIVTGSDLDGRSIRGRPNRNVVTNFEQYHLVSNYLDSFISDLTNSPLRTQRYLDGIVCDPPYGVREGLKVLGRRDGLGKEAVYIDGKPAHLQPGFIPPKKPYSFEAMLDDILEFAAMMLLDNARLSMWMPTANDDEIELDIPAHPYLHLVNVSVQPFNKWARRLLTYRRIPDADVEPGVTWQRRTIGEGVTASELNNFRKKYFGGFREQQPGYKPPSA